MKSWREGNCFRLVSAGKNQLGGKRRGAGRKLNLARLLLKRFSRETIA